jgi:hypothetical protein
MQDWLQQHKLQLVRRYKGRPSDFARVALAYTKAAAERMELWKGVDGGRRAAPPQRTLEEAKKWEHHVPRPQCPPALPAGGGGGGELGAAKCKATEKRGSGDKRCRESR